MARKGEIIKHNNSLEFPLLTIKGKEDGPVTVITAGIHGCEYAPINTLYELYEQLVIKKVNGKIILMPIVDIKGFIEKKMFVCPVDNKNINRVFPGKETGSYSEQLIYYIFNKYIKKADYYIDLHCADLIEDMMPFIEIHESGNSNIDKESKKMAEYYGIKDITIKKLQGEVNDKGQSYSAAVETGVPAILANAGKIGDKKGELIHFEGLSNVLKYIGNIEGKAKRTEKAVYYQPPVHIKSEEKGLFFSFVDVGNYIEKDAAVGKIVNYTGQEIYTVTAPVSGIILLKNAGTAVKKGSLLLEILVEM